MKIATDNLKLIAATLGLGFIRSVDLSHANVDVHYSSDQGDLMVYNGRSTINTLYEGSTVLDLAELEIYFLVKKDEKDSTGEQVDDYAQAAKLYANKTYFNLQSATPKNIEPYRLEPVEEFTDMYEGYKMTITVPFYNEGC